MELQNVKVNYHYFISDLSYTVHVCSEAVYIKEYQNIFKDAWEVLEKGGQYPTCKNPFCGSCFQPKPNDVKLLHKRTGIILYINALNLSKTKPNCQPYDNKKNCNVNDTEKIYDYSLNSPYGLSNLSNNSLKLQLQTQETPQDKYSPENIQNTYDKATEQEFKIEKRTRDEKVEFLLNVLDIYINDALDKGDKNKFYLYSKRYEKIKNL